MDRPTDPLEAVARARCISLTTFRRDGTPVSTPVWLNVMDGRIMVTTPATAAKVKRIANDPQVEFAACTQRGKVTGPVFTRTARVISGAELVPVLKAKRRRYFTARFIQMMPSARNQVGLEITPHPPATAP